MKKAFVSWSGGKDCCQAAYQAIQQGFNIKYLLNMVTNDSRRSCSHGIGSRWIRMQSEAMGIPIMQQPTTGDNYEAVFSNALLKMKAEGIHYGVFGDIDFIPHLEWIERVCASAGIMPVLPLWKKDQEKIVRSFIDLGFVSVVVATQADLLEEEWLGRKLDADFIKDLKNYDENVTPCGEAGEFHTLVIDGPLFNRRLEVRKAEKVKREKNWFLDIKQIDLVEKD